MHQLRGIMSRIARAIAQGGLMAVGIITQIGTYLLLVTGCSSNGKSKRNEPEKPEAEIKWESTESKYRGKTTVHEDGSRDEHTKRK